MIAQSEKEKLKDESPYKPLRANTGSQLNDRRFSVKKRNFV